MSRGGRTPVFRQLQRVFAAYLHEDFLVEHGTPEGALDAFRADASPRELELFRREAKRFLAHTSTLDFGEVQEFVRRLGSRWVPPSREALIALLQE